MQEMRKTCTVTILPSEGLDHSIQVPTEYVLECKTLANSLEWCVEQDAPVIPISFSKRLMELTFEFIRLKDQRETDWRTNCDNIEAWMSSIPLHDLTDLCNVSNFFLAMFTNILFFFRITFPMKLIF